MSGLALSAPPRYAEPALGPACWIPSVPLLVKQDCRSPHLRFPSVLKPHPLYIGSAMAVLARVLCTWRHSCPSWTWASVCVACCLFASCWTPISARPMLHRPMLTLRPMTYTAMTTADEFCVDFWACRGPSAVCRSGRSHASTWSHTWHISAYSPCLFANKPCISSLLLIAPCSPQSGSRTSSPSNDAFSICQTPCSVPGNWEFAHLCGAGAREIWLWPWHVSDDASMRT